MPYEFDRRIDGQLMAEGCRITHAASEAEALAKARAIYANGARQGEMERTTFVPRVPQAVTNPWMIEIIAEP